MIGQLLVALLVIPVVVGKAAVFYRGLNERKADNMKQTLLDFSFIFFFFFLGGEAENCCSRRVRELERGGVSGR